MPTRVDVDLVYSAAAACADLPPLPSDAELLGRLLPASTAFQGRAQLAKVSATPAGAGCVLYLDVGGAASQEGDALDVAATLNSAMTSLTAADSALRGGATTMLSLQRASVSVGAKTFAISVTPSPTEPSSTLTVSSVKCVDGVDLSKLVPSAVDAGELQIARSASASTDCRVELDLTGRASGVTVSSAFELLQAMDTQLDAVVNQADAQLDAAAVQLQIALPDSTISTATKLVATSSEPVLEYNAPSQEMTLAIFMGFMMLTAMLLGVVFTKKRHDDRCRERYERANRVAQIHRVTLKMTHEGGEEDANDEEDDSLL